MAVLHDMGYATGRMAFSMMVISMVLFGLFYGIYFVSNRVQRLCETEPNQAPEPTPTTVTPPAGQEARQP